MPRRVRDNIVLIGMPGAGKSTVGVLLAKATSRGFFDTDVLIQSFQGRRLQDIIDEHGIEPFLEKEEESILALHCRATVIATGGSVVYSDRAMKHLKRRGVIVHLDLSLSALEERLTNLDTRGIAMKPGQTLAGLYDEREPLYRRWAEIAIDCEGKTHEEVVVEVAERIEDVKM